MNKIELARAIQKARGCTQTEATELLNTVIEVFTEQLSKDNSITLQGFGTLKPWHQTLRDGRNPKTGVPVTIPPRISVKFRPGKFLLDALNKSE